METENFYMLAKTMYGLEEVLADELKELGAQNIKILNRAVSFKGDKGFMYKCNLGLRTAIKILKPIKQFHVKDENDLYKKIKSIGWEDYLDADGSLAVSATLSGDTFTHCLLYTSPSPRDATLSRMPSSA